MMRVLQQERKWFADGTFKVVPELFYQLYSIHCDVRGSVLPAAYILMTSKSASTYERALTALKNVCEITDGPSTIVVDFEQAAVSAFQCVFPNASIKGCFFHLSQCVYRKLQQSGLQERYKDDAGINIHARMIPALALVPERDVVSAFEELSTVVPDDLHSVLDYFEDNFVGRLTAHGRRSPRFLLTLWNHYDTVLDLQPKTTNSVEAWHRGFQAHVQCSHPTLWKFLEVLHREDALTVHKLLRLRMGDRPNPAKKYRDCATRLQALAREYSREHVLSYLRGVAHNIEF